MKKKSAKKRTTSRKTAAVQVGDDARFPGCFLHPNCTVEGLVEMGPECSIWAGAVLRADMNTIRLGRGVNIQDNTTLHVDSRHPIVIGDYTLVGHNAMIHGCTVGRACMIGIGSIVLDGAEIGDGAMVTAGCLIRGGARIPAHALVIQKDGKLIVAENRARSAYTLAGSLEYIELARRFRSGQWGPFTREHEEELFRQAERMLVEMGIKDEGGRFIQGIAR